MPIKAFFEKVIAQFEQELPFVCFAKDSELKAYFQKNAALNTISNFNRSGFVFTPFTNHHPSVIFETDTTETIKADIEDYKIEIDQSFRDLSTDESSAFDKKQEHLDLVTRAVEHINSSDVRKIVCSRQIVITHKIHPILTFQKLYQKYPGAFCYCWYHPKVGLWLGASPEQFVHVERRNLRTVALAGTQSKAAFPKAKWSPKEVEEQQMVTDYILSVLEKYSNTVHVGQLETVAAGNLWHLKTKINARIDDTKLSNVLKDLHPTSAVCGLPKEESLDFILKHEGYDRAYYTGFLGELNVKKVLNRTNRRRNQEFQAIKSITSITDLYVNLRCMQIKDNQVIIYVGGGITKDSDPEAEFFETLSKSQTMLNVL
jgi:isochorismate synthase